MSSRRGRKKGALTFVDRDKAMQMAEFEKLKVSKFGDQIAKGMKDKQLVQKAAQVHTHSCTRYNIKIYMMIIAQIPWGIGNLLPRRNIFYIQCRKLSA